MADTKKLTKFIYTLFAVLVISGVISSGAQTNLPESFLIGDSDGIYVETDGEYLIHADNLTPGEVIVKTLTIRNLERGKTPFKLSMTAEPGQISGPVSLLDTMTLTITMEGNILYHGRLRGDEGNNMTRNALPLGTYVQGDSKTLQIRIEAGDFEQNEEKSVAEITWNFYAVKDESVKPPVTGDFVHYGLYGLSALISSAAIILLLLRNRREENEDNI